MNENDIFVFGWLLCLLLMFYQFLLCSFLEIRMIRISLKYNDCCIKMLMLVCGCFVRIHNDDKNDLK